MADKPVPVYIGVGSNIDPEANILRALAMLQERARVTGASTFYRTAAIGRPEQAAYLNGVWRIETPIAPRDLKFDVLRGIEDRLGRVRTSDKYAARTIDLDMLLYGDLVLTDADCRVPAPEIRDRVFLQAGVLELAPGLLLPDTREPLATLMQAAEAAAMEPAVEFTDSLRSRLDPSASRQARD